MCTVSFIPTEKGFWLTSNRDEDVLRPTLPPLEYDEKDLHLVYPKDTVAKGTWIALSPGNKRAACLLNGAFNNHIKQKKYRCSRGQILLDSFVFPNPGLFSILIELDEIEPFTLILLDCKRGKVELNELIWDGKKKYYSTLDSNKPQIWSSATLYDDIEREMRRQWFDNWLRENANKTAFDISGFHQKRHSAKDSNDIVMDRGTMKTLSISQIIYDSSSFIFRYSDLLNKIEKKLKYYCE